MARGRMLNNSISRSLKFDLLPDDTCRLLATWIISHLDFRGVFYADAIMVKSLVFTRRNDIADEQIEEYLQAMVKVGLITLFEAKGQRWQYWPEFAANQVGLRAEREKTDFPVPPGYSLIPADSPQDDGEETADSPQDDGEETADRRQDDGEKSAEVESEIQDQSQGKLKDLAPSAGADAPLPPAPPSKSKRKTKPKTSTPPAVKVFQENAHRYPPKAWYSKIADAVGDAPADLELWGQIVLAYIGLGWNPSNVTNMLEFYGRREIPATKGRGKANTRSAPDEWLARRQEAGIGGT